MNKQNRNCSIVILLVLLFSASAYAQNGKSIWAKTSKERTSHYKLVFRKSQPNVSDIYKLNIEALKNKLVNVPKRTDGLEPSNVIINFPEANGKITSYRIKEASIMSDALQIKYPNIQSYVGQGVENPASLIRFSITPQGLHSMRLNTGNGAEFIDPYTKDGDYYIVYAKRDLPALAESLVCHFNDNTIEDNIPDFNAVQKRNANDSMLRTFRLAIACTIEYADFHIQAAGLGAAPLAQKKAAVMAAMNVTMTRVNGVYEKELSVTMLFVPNNDDIIFVNADNFDNGDADILINESQQVIDNIIGNANYDIGHTFSTGGGGLAALNSPCNNANKARGITGQLAPIGDPFDIDFVAHEMGHQFGAPHTFNGTTGSCAGNNRNPVTAYEPGSGTTIMAYAGICGVQNVQGNSDVYFHQTSLQFMWNNITLGNSTCGALVNTGNTAPIAEAGANFTIPITTPYMLTGASNDPDGTATHTYTWEQYNLGPAGVPTEATVAGPLVRSFEGTSNKTRYIPRLSDLITSNGSTEWEKLASVNRDINFQLTVRDNDANGGQTATDNMTATVTNTAGPFIVTSQNNTTTWSQGNTETITWNVAGTNAGAVNTPNVDILLSTDGGLTYPTTLATAVPNDGAQDIIVPNMNAENCRVMVKGNGNIFFNINTARFAIGFNLTPGEVCNTYNYVINQALSPNAQNFQNFGGQNVPDSGIITDVNVNYDVTTANISQLHMRLVSPNGSATYLFQGNNSCANGGNMQVTWDDEAAAPVVCGNTPTVGTATVPVNGQVLSVFDGEEMNGNWIFQAADLGNTNMVFNTVDLEICKNDFAATAAPNRVNQSVVQVAVLSTVTVEDTNIKVTSANTVNAVDIVYTLTVLPTKGTLFLSGNPLVLAATFTQDDIDNDRITYTTTSANTDTDFFRVDVSDSNAGSLPNLLVNIQIEESLSVDENSFELSNITIYPNPTNGIVNVSINTDKDVNILLYDMRGRKVYTNYYKNNSDTFNAEVNLGSIASGIYMLKVESEGKKYLKKLLVD